MGLTGVKGVHVRKNGYLASPDDSIVNKKRVMKEIQEAFQDPNFKRVVIYYSGHGQKSSGAWCFDDGSRILPSDVFDLVPTSHRLLLITDSCYSGEWVDAAKGDNIYVQASCASDDVSYDTASGGEFTKRFIKAAHEDVFPVSYWPGHAFRGLGFVFRGAGNLLSKMSNPRTDKTCLFRLGNGQFIATFDRWTTMDSGFN